MLAIEGIDLKELALQTEAWFPPDSVLDLYLDIGRDLNQQQLDIIQKQLAANGMKVMAPVSIGAGPWEDTLNIKYQNVPPSSNGVAAIGGLPPAAVIILALGAVGIASIGGWKVMSAVRENFNLIAILALVGFLGYALIGKKK